MIDSNTKRFGFLQFRCPHIACSVSNTHLVDFLWIVCKANSFIVNLDFLAWLKIVVGDHLITTAEQDLADLHGRQPTDVYVGDRTTVIEHRDIGEVLWCSWKMINSSRRNCIWMLFQQMVQNRKIVDSQIGDNINVVLE